MPSPFDTFSRDMLNHFLPGQQAMQDIAAGTDVESVSASGAISTTVRNTELAVSGTAAYTLADGPAGIAGRVKVITCVSAASTPLGTLTITSPDTTTGFVCPSTFLFTTAGQSLTLMWTGTKWRCIAKQRAGVTALVVGTTVTTGIANMTHLDLSVTGTVSSTTAANRGIPNGAAVGELLAITVSTAASTPAGTIQGVFQTKAGANTGTSLATFGAVTDQAVLEWNGSAWKPYIMVPTTLTIS